MPLNLGDQHINLTDAAAMTARFRQNNPLGTIVSHMLSKEIIEEILAQPGCEGIRIYNAIDDSNIATLVITGVDASQNDMYDGVLAEHTYKCPTICPVGNPLNS
ncbi:MAG: hypothetical protein IT245_05740 [Bacteroidia bacterium]|nr:hypothetical protein [Bacteroidia bacterium]